MKKKVEEENRIADKALDKLIDFVDSDVPYAAFCAILCRIYWSL